MKLSINKKIINKNETNAHQSKSFEAQDLTVDEFVKYINDGCAFSYQFRDDYRKADNFICSDIIAADFDSGMTLEEALSDDFFTQNASFLYTTPSHTPDHHRFRVIFHLPHTITDKELIRSAQTGLTRKFPADVAAVDPARQFYGSKNSNPHLFGKTLSEQNLDELIKLGAPKLKLTDSTISKNILAGSRSEISIDNDMFVKDAHGDLQKLSDLDIPTPIYCPFHHDNKPSAFTTKSKTGAIGIHCSSSKCQQTFWVKDSTPPPYDFYAFDKLVKAESYKLTSDYLNNDLNQSGFDVRDNNLILNQPFLNELPIFDGITCIKSPKGTGKTQYLKQVVKTMKAKRKKILMIGHRRSLLRSLSKELGLDCYLGDEKLSQRDIRNSNKNYFAVSVDSISTCLNTLTDKFDVVLIDESEQVFSHLISDTMPLNVRNLSYKTIKHYVRMSKTCIALDADLNNITLSTISGFGHSNPFIDRAYILNLHKPEASQLEMFSSENHLIGQMFNDLRTGKKLYVCSNSKTKIDELELAIKREFGQNFPIFTLTGKNSNDLISTRFIKNIKTEILKYQVVLTSPVLGTGVDITFPDKEQLVDGVYGLFEARINTHTDIDQQLARVRHPGFIRVWVSPETFNFETEVEPIRQELAESGAIPDVLLNHSWKGLPEYKLDDPYLNLYTNILSAQRASKNNIKDNFINLRKYNGWKIIEITSDKTIASEGRNHKGIGKTIKLDEYVRGILNVSSINADELTIITDKKTEDRSQEERCKVDRYFIEHFYYEPITEAMLIRDNFGMYRKQVQMLEGLMSVAGEKHSVLASKTHLFMKSILSSAKLLDNSGLPDINVTLTLESLNDFVKFCTKEKSKINRIFKIDIRKDLKQSPINQLETFLKLCGLSKVLIRKYELNKVRIYEYGIDPEKYREILGVINTRKAKNLS